MARTKKDKPLTPRAEMKDLRTRIQTIKEAHRAGLRHDLTPLVRRLQVLMAAEALRRAEKALLKTVEADKVNPQLELLGNLPAETQLETPLLRTGSGELWVPEGGRIQCVEGE